MGDETYIEPHSGYDRGKHGLLSRTPVHPLIDPLRTRAYT
jgi:hypothetical protein